MTNRAGTSFAQNVKTLRMERPDRLVAPVFHVARGCLRHLPQRDKAGERERPVTTRIPRRSARGRPGAAHKTANAAATAAGEANSDSTNATATSASAPYS